MSEGSEGLIPLFDRVLLRRPVERKTAGGVILTDRGAKEMSGLRCTVLAVGPTCESGLAVGEEVLVSQHGGAWISPSGKGAARVDTETFIISEVDILAKVSK